MRAPDECVRQALQIRKEIILSGRAPEDGWFAMTLNEVAAFTRFAGWPDGAEPKRIAGLNIVRLGSGSGDA